MPIILFQAGTQASLLFKYSQGLADHYLPTAISIVLVNWWGPMRILPAIYINALLSCGFWGIDDVWQWPIYAIPETIFPFISWVLFQKFGEGKYWIPNVRTLVVFILGAVSLPIILEVALLQAILIYFDVHRWDEFWPLLVRNSLGEFTSNFGLALPILYYASPYVQRVGLLHKQPPELIRKHKFPYGKKGVFELMFIYALLLMITFFIPMDQFWFVCGILALYVAIRFGFGITTVTNYYIFLITYFIPIIAKGLYNRSTIEPQMLNIFLGMMLLYVFAAITGRVISDLKQSERNIIRKNAELEQANSELDRFVYSASHDLSAPLKSIRGLVNVSRIDKQQETDNYLSKIEVSALKLETFISEILDYSRNRRLLATREPVHLKELCLELIENLKFLDNFQNIKIILDVPENFVFITDKMRLKIILNNILSNAVKFHKRSGSEGLFIKVHAQAVAQSILISVEDNGEGIRPEFLHDIFKMFFRATEIAKGSGLGLYIAKEAAEKIGGAIRVKSEFENGSIFTLELPIRP